MKKLMTKDGNDYRTFGVFLKRKGIENSYRVASLLIDKFVFSKEASCYYIDCDELKEKNILPGEKHKTFTHWRDEMIRKGVVICMADKKELLEKIPNHKGNLFKPGPKIKKHIDKIVMKNVPEKFTAIGERFEKIENKMEEFDERFDKVISMLLKVAPPDSDVRRQIIRENFMDNEKCFELLSNETKEWLKDSNEKIDDKYKH